MKFTKHDNIIDSRDVIEHLEELTEERDMLQDALNYAEATDESDEDITTARIELESWLEDNEEELKELEALAEQGAQYIADWAHGAILINEDYFTEYAKELAYDIGAVGRDDGWPTNCIDWDEAAEELKQDYTELSFGGQVFLGVSG